MKSFKSLILAALTLLGAASARADMPSTHGMLVVGNGPIYLSHLPMFHAPHDYQAIFAVEMDPPATLHYKRHKAASAPNGIYTLVPERFSLPELAAQPFPFKAQLYAGHFERGGKVLVKVVQVRVIKVLLFKKLDPNEQRPQLASYYLFGKPGDAYLAHAITERPNFDQISSVMKISPLLEKILASSGIVRLQGDAPDEDPLKATDSVLNWALVDSPRAPREQTQWIFPIYTEHGDLE